MRLSEDDLELMYDITVHDQIMNIVKVSTEPFIGIGEPLQVQKAGRLSKNSAKAAQVQEIEQSYDMVFILTVELGFLFYRHHSKDGLTLMSEGSLVDIIGSKRDAPFDVVVGPKSRFLALMIYDNTVKILPIEKVNGVIQIAQPFNLKIRYPEALSIMPYYQEEQVLDGPLLVFYKQQVHGMRPNRASQISLKVRKYNLSIIDKDLKQSDANSTEDTVEL